MKGRALRLNYLKFLSTCIGLTLWSFGLSQNLSVVDKSGSSLESVLVYNSDKSFSALTDEHGLLKLPSLETGDSLTFQLLGYHSLTLSYHEIIQLNNQIVLSSEDVLLDEFVVVGRRDERPEDMVMNVAVIDQKKISLTNPQTSADALSQHGNIFVQKSQMGGGSPVIRGFEANKILLVVDGVRMNNAIYRNGHLQNAITVDQSLVDRTEVILGPGSLAYGSDALGGVIHFRTIQPKLNLINNSTEVRTNVFARYASANKERSVHAHVNLGSKKSAHLLSFTSSFFDDLRMGSRRTSKYPEYGKRSEYVISENNMDQIINNPNENIQVGTAYSQYDFFLKSLFQLTNDFKLVTNIQYSTSSDIPRYDQLIDRNGDLPNFAEWYYGPQTRFLVSSQISWSKNTPLFDDVLCIPSFQFIEEDRIDRRFNSNIKSTQNEDVYIPGLTFDFRKKYGQSQLIYGADYQFNQVRSSAIDEDILTADISTGITRYPNENGQMGILGLYSQWSQAFENNIRWNSGIRFSHSTLSLKYKNDGLILWPSNFYEGLNSSNQSFTASTGLVYNNDRWEIRTLIASAFRAPNIDDMAKIRIKNGEITVPNLDLSPEKSITGELSLGTKWNSNSRFSTTGFYTRISEAIIRQAFTLPGGIDTLIDEGDSLSVVANVNAESGYILGFSANLDYEINDDFSFSASANYTYGRSEIGSFKRPLSHIPPLYGQLAFSYAKNNLTSQCVWRYNGQKAIENYGDSTDNPEFATPEGALRWNTLNIYTQYNLGSLNFGVGVENVLDVHYRPFASGLSGAGRNFIFSLRYRP